MSGRLLQRLRLCCIFAFLFVLLSNRANAVLLNNYRPFAGAVVSSATESVYPAILPTLFASGLPQNSRLPELPGGVITDPLDISETFGQTFYPTTTFSHYILKNPTDTPWPLQSQRSLATKFISAANAGEK